MFNTQRTNTMTTARFGSNAVIARARQGFTLSEEDMIRSAPSIFAPCKHESRSERYAYIPTVDVLRGLQKEGFSPVEIRQGGSRKADKLNFTKHMIRMRHASQTDLVGGDSFRELILVNSHDGTSSYQLMSGLFRMVCTNGLITCDEGEMQRVPHKGNVVDQVIEGAYSIMDNAKSVAHEVSTMQALMLTSGEQQAFARAALALRYDNTDDDGKPVAAPVDASQVLTIRREADMGNDMWRTFNRVQEHLVRGGLGYTTRAANGRRTARSTRPVNSIDGNVTLNRALWVLSQEMLALKSAH